VATTAMLTFISFWRAAAIVLNDLASSAFYAGGIAEHFIGKSAPWFILAIMLFSYAVRAVYIESCSMFVRGGVYRVVKEAMGETLAKFSVSALMFDYILTGPISGVSAGQYLAGLLNDVLRYMHSTLIMPANLTAAAFAAFVTVYFWRQNVKGIEVSSDKALQIMQLTTVMVVLMIVWCCYTIWLRGAQLPPWPRPRNLTFSGDALGWLRGTKIPYTLGFVGILIGLGHSVLAMSGEETLAQVYREIEAPKLPNLKKAGFVIFVYSLVFTSLVSFFAVMIIPDSVRPEFKDNLISGLAMSAAGPYILRLVFQGFVVVVGILILSGAVNTAIVGSNGVLNRVSEDAILPEWFRRPHHRFGTSYRIINSVAGIQLLAILLSGGDVIVLGEAYAFGVMWSFTMKSLGVLVLRFTEPGERKFRVPLNVRVGRHEIPIGLMLITLALFVIAITNLFTKQIATVSGITFTLVFFAALTISERLTREHGARPRVLDEFNLEPREELSPATVGVRPGNIAVMIRDYNTLYPLAAVLNEADPKTQDVIVVHLRLLARAVSGEHGLTPEQLFTFKENELFTRALNMAEKSGKTIHLAVVPARAKWDGILRTAQSLQSARVVLGLSPRKTALEEVRLAGLAWERLPEPKPHFCLTIYSPKGEVQTFCRGPDYPHVTPNDIELLQNLWLELRNALGPEEPHPRDVVRFALSQLKDELGRGKRQEIINRFRDHIQKNKAR
jgi:amino acid transporter